MKLGWKALIPISLVWIIVIATIQALRQENLLRRPDPVGLRRSSCSPLILGHRGSSARSPRRSRRTTVGEFDAFAGGYPVPPMPGQVLPELHQGRRLDGRGRPGVVGEEQ